MISFVKWEHEGGANASTGTKAKTLNTPSVSGFTPTGLAF